MIQRSLTNWVGESFRTSSKHERNCNCDYQDHRIPTETPKTQLEALNILTSSGRARLQTEKYFRLLLSSTNGLTDHEAAARLGIPNTSVAARRNELRKKDIVDMAKDEYGEVMTRKGPSGVSNIVWTISELWFTPSERLRK